MINNISEIIFQSKTIPFSTQQYKESSVTNKKT